MRKKRVKISKYSRLDRKSFGFCFALLAIPVAQFLLMWVYVNFNSIILAFKQNDGTFGFGNFIDVFNAFSGTEPIYNWNLGDILGRTVILWVVVNVICTPLIMLSTYVLYKKIAFSGTFRTIFAIPSILGIVVWSVLMKQFAEPDGPIIKILLKMGVSLSDDILNNGLFGAKSTAFLMIIIIDVLPSIIACNLIITGAFARIPPEIFESAKIDGFGFFQEFIHIGIPMAWPTIVVTLVTSLATIFTANGNVLLYTRGINETSTMGFYLYYVVLHISEAGGSVSGTAFSFPAALGIVLTLMTLPIVLISRYFLEKAYGKVEY